MNVRFSHWPTAITQRASQEKEHIEIGEDVFLHDLPGSLARRLDRAVVQTGGDPLGHLRFAQAGLRRGEEHGDVDRRLRLRQGF